MDGTIEGSEVGEKTRDGREVGGDLNRERERWTHGGYMGDRWAHGQGQTSRERRAGVCEKTRERVPVREQEGVQTHRNPWRMECRHSVPNLITKCQFSRWLLGSQLSATPLSRVAMKAQVPGTVWPVCTEK